jgi:hypothetical protein
MKNWFMFLNVHGVDPLHKSGVRGHLQNLFVSEIGIYLFFESLLLYRVYSMYAVTEVHTCNSRYMSDCDWAGKLAAH